MNDRKRLAAYLVLDLITTWVAWVLFNVVRFYAFRATIGFPDLKAFLTDTKSVVISLIIPWFWVFLHFMSGYYTQPRRKTNLGDLLHTMLVSLIGIIILFFAVVINDYPENPSLYYNILISYFLIQSVCNWLGRFMLTGPMVIGQAKGKNNVPVLVIGTGQAARQVMSQFNAYRCNTPYRLEGFVRSGFESADQVPAALCLGEGEELADCIRQLGIEELFLALDHHQPAARLAVLNRLYPYRLPIKSLASREEIVSGKVPLFSLFGIPLVPLTPVPMPVWQQQLKWLSDKLMAFTGLVLLSPLLLFLALRVKAESPGPIIYKQERVGKQGKPFIMYKFRTMYEEAEANGPQLSSLDDNRITPFGRFMRKYRLDELPQFINVLKGDMSLVGPRPERPCYVAQILEKAPHYYLVQQVLPGITSWGMVKYGYANSVEQMIQRLEYDMLYLENQSLLLDCKILLFTIKPLISGKGM